MQPDQPTEVKKVYKPVVVYGYKGSILLLVAFLFLNAVGVFFPPAAGNAAIWPYVTAIVGVLAGIAFLFKS